MTVIEKIVDDMLGKFKMSTTAIDLYFNHSEDIKRFEKSSLVVDKLEEDKAKYIDDLESLRTTVTSLQVHD
jgi:hypothetical protein